MKTITALLDHSETTPSHSAARWALASLALSMLMPSLDTSIAHTALPVLAQAFDASFQQLQWIVLAYLLIITSLIVGVGRLGDLFGRRRVLLGGIALFSTASLLCGVAPSLWFLLVARAVQGLGAAIMLALAAACVSQVVARERTGRAMGLLGTLSALGTTLGPALGGLLLAGAGWRSIFLINVPLGVLNFVLAWRYLPVDSEGSAMDKGCFDHVGTLLFACVLAAFALAMTLGNGRFGVFNGALLLAALTGAAIFVRVEATAAAPLISLHLLRDTELVTRLLMGLLVAAVIMSTLVVGPFYLSLALGLNATAAGLALSAGPLAAALAGMPAGRMVDRLGAKRMTMAGLSGMAAACCVLFRVTPTWGVAGYLAPICCLTASYALFQAANTTAVMSGSHGAQRGMMSGMLTLSRNLGLISGASLLGAVFVQTTGTSNLGTAVPYAVAHGMRLTFAVAGGLMLLALLIGAGSVGRNRQGG